MIRKVLLSDDLASINHGILSVLQTLGIDDNDQVQYCDDAYLKVKRAITQDVPYDLLITDLSFKPDHRPQQFASGEALVKQLKQEFPDLKIIVYSIEDRLQSVKRLLQDYKANAYVCKGRKGLTELAEAIAEVDQNKRYLSPQVAHALSPKADLEIDDFDIALLQELSLGLSQEEISHQLKTQNISPNSLSTIEKRLNKLRIQFKANNAIHLVSIVKDLGVI